MDEAHNKTMKIERLQSRAPPFRHPLSIEEPLGDEVVQPSSTKVDQPLACITVGQSSYVDTNNKFDSRKGQRKSLLQAWDRQVLQVWRTWVKIQKMSKEEANQHGRLW